MFPAILSYFFRLNSPRGVSRPFRCHFSLEGSRQVSERLTPLFPLLHCRSFIRLHGPLDPVFPVNMLRVTQLVLGLRGTSIDM
jgi:hypothetical protein